MTGNVRPTLLVLMAVVLLVLLIACGNVANLQLARGLERDRELSIRKALGADRKRVVGQLLTESAILAIVGGVAGVAVAYRAVPAVVARSGGLLPRAAEVSVDGSVLLFAGVVTALTALVFGAAPAWKLSGGAGSERLVGSRAPSGRVLGGRTWGVLVAAQVSLSTVVVIASGLLLRSVWELQSVDVGLDTEQLVTMSLTMNDARYPEQADYLGFYDRLLDEIGSLGGVESVASIRFTPLRRDGESGSFTIPGRSDAAEDRPQARIVQVSPGFFATAGVPLLGGRDFTDLDDESSVPVVIVNDALRRRYWPGEDPVGQSLQIGRAPVPVVGWVGDVRQQSLAADPVPTIYVSQRQNSRRGMTFVARTSGDPRALMEPMRSVVRRIDADQPIQELAPMTDVVFSAAAQPRFFALLLGSFGLLAIVLSSVGIYGVVSHSVSVRVPEIGVRVALGAPRSGVARMVVGSGLRPVAVGALVGVVLAAGAARGMRETLYGVSTVDPLTFVGVPSLLILIAAWASWVPAARAARIDPTEALRAE